MKLPALASLLWCAGCSLYFGSPSQPGGDPASPGDDVSDPGSTPGDNPGGGTGGMGDAPLPRCTPGAAEVHVVGVYETRSDHSFGDHPVGEGSVTIERPGTHVLVLSAYEPTK